MNRKEGQNRGDKIRLGVIGLRKRVGREEFALVHLLVALVCGWGWVAAPQTGVATALLPLLALPVLLFWFARTIAGRTPFPRTRIDFLVWAFVVSAGIGVWASYNRGTALSKFFVLLGAVFVYYAIVGTSRRGMLFTVLLLGVLGAGVALHFLFTQDWTLEPADFGVINRLALWWMSVRPNGVPGSLHQNFAGGLIAIFIPLQIWMLGYARARKDRFSFWLGTGLLGISILGLIFSSSRAAWLALGCGLVAWLFLRLDQTIGLRFPARQRLALWGSVVLVGLLAAILLVAASGGVTALFNRLPGPGSMITRLEIDRTSLRLVEDYRFIGGGLSAFPGLFSQYQLVIPSMMFEYGHNLYLDVILGQGILGLVALLGMLAFSLVVCLGCPSWKELPGLNGALLAGLVVLCLHGLVDDALYGMSATPVLFALPGLAAAIERQRRHKQRVKSPATNGTRWKAGAVMGLPVITVALGLGGLMIFRQPIAGAWQANLGAVELAQIDLARFPTNEWRTPGELPAAAQAVQHLEVALQLDPKQRTAHQRLGLVALQEMDFGHARWHLEQALALDPGHRGVRKNLGYAYVWLGMYDRAAEVLEGIPEAQKELQYYADAWRGWGRMDLSRRATDMAERLGKEAGESG